MARLGIIVMDLCRPIAFAPEKYPSVGSLVGNVCGGCTIPAQLSATAARIENQAPAEPFSEGEFNARDVI